MEVKDGEDIIAFKWDKKNTSIENHFWDVRIYNLAARDVLMDLYKRADPKTYRYIDWPMYVQMALS